jgi:hypothetical protein
MLASMRLFDETLTIPLPSRRRQGESRQFPGKLCRQVEWPRSQLLGLIGVLMNARGMMELISLKIGLELGVISPTFAMLVPMAVITTFAAVPMRQWLRASEAPRKQYRLITVKRLSPPAAH